MINAIIASILSLFFWGKATKEIEEKTQLASLTKTFIFFVLSLAVALFYYKTYQVATIYSYIDVQGIQESKDANGNIADTVDIIRIENRFSSGITEHQDLNEKRSRINDPLATDFGGIFVKILMRDDSIYKSERNPDFKDYIIDVPIKDIDHCYKTYLVSTSFPSIFPFYPAWSHNEEWTSDTNDAYLLLAGGDIKNNAIFVKSYRSPNLEGENIESEFERSKINGSFNAMLSASKRSSQKASYVKAALSGSFLNTINFFSAADLSQYIQAIQIKSSCPVRYLEVSYDLPIEVENYDSCMTIGPTGFGFKGDYLDQMVNDSSHFLVKMPTLSNLQLIRSLILTTLLTALLALFFTNLFYVIRKKAIEVKEKKFVAVSDIKVKQFKIKMIILLIVLSGISLYLLWLVYKDSPIYYPAEVLEDYFKWFVLGVILIILIIIYLVYWQFRKAYNIKKKDNKK